MKRPPKRMALYEVMGKKQTKSILSKSLESLRPPEKEKKAIAAISPLPEKSSEKQVKWANKPKFLQLNAGRVEMSIPYQVAVAAVLIAFVAVLVSFRLGKASGNQTAGMVNIPAPVKKNVKKPVNKPVNRPKVESSGLPIGLVAKDSAPKPALPAVNATGSNIVIQTLKSRNDLEPVKDYFAANGIATKIRTVKGLYYFLITVNKYESLKKTGSEGNNMLKRIVELGAGYKAPPGFETFRVKGKTPFQDAYGMKFDD